MAFWTSLIETHPKYCVEHAKLDTSFYEEPPGIVEQKSPPEADQRASETIIFEISVESL